MVLLIPGIEELVDMICGTDDDNDDDDDDDDNDDERIILELLEPVERSKINIKLLFTSLVKICYVIIPTALVIILFWNIKTNHTNHTNHTNQTNHTNHTNHTDLVEEK